jgi:protein-S-isoprenylcysteine O-methyltransferase Ste14
VTRRYVFPPHYALLFVGGEIALDRWLPVLRLIPAPWHWSGAAVFALSFFIGAWAFSLFRRNKTGVVPFSESTAVVTAGPYRFTRNPMYLGMAGMLLGIAFYLGSLTPLLGPLVFVLVITYRFIVHEEAHMERAMGAAYLAYKAKVRRWL